MCKTENALKLEAYEHVAMATVNNKKKKSWQKGVAGVEARGRGYGSQWAGLGEEWVKDERDG